MIFYSINKSSKHKYKSNITLQKKSILYTFLRRFLYAIKMHIMHKTKMLLLLKIRPNIKYWKGWGLNWKG